MNSPVLRELKTPFNAKNKPERRPKVVTAKDSRLFSTALLEVDETGRVWRIWSAIFSFAFQLLAVAALSIVPLMFPGAIPARYIVTSLIAAPPPSTPPTPRGSAARPAKIAGEIVKGRLVAPLRVPSKIKMVHGEQAPPVPEGLIGGVIGGVSGGLPGGVIGGILSSIPARKVIGEPPRQPARVQEPQRVRISEGVTQGMLLSMVKPAYPSGANVARIEGNVLLKAVIGRDGTISELQVVSGSPFLASAAIGAVKQWRYRPYLLNGLPVEAETVITVRFRLEG